MEFKQVSHTVWESLAPGWDERHAYFEEIARPVTECMLARIAPSPGDMILDVAAGTGIAGLAAAARVGPTGRVIVSDFAAPMVEAATRHADAMGIGNVECRLLDAEQLDLPDESIDGVLCRWGYMLMGNPGAALREAHRVLRGGGRIAFAVFAGPQENPWASIPARILVERGHMAPPEPGAPGILALADRDRLRQLTSGAGFDEVTIEAVDFVVRGSDFDDYWALLSHTAGPIAAAIGRLPSDARDSARAAVAEAVSRFAGEEIRIPAQSLVVSAAR
jgi:ubiquinone/menaquinone biosynthesis C-methylase UbiE